MRATLFFAALLSLIPGPLFAGSPTVQDGVEVSQVWARPTDATVGQVFLRVANQRTASIVLRGGTTEVATAVSVYGAATPAGPQRSVRLGRMTVDAGRALSLAPAGVFLRLDGLQAPLLSGDRFMLTLRIEPIGPIAVEVSVGDPQSDMPVAGAP